MQTSPDLGDKRAQQGLADLSSLTTTCSHFLTGFLPVGYTSITLSQTSLYL